ncbi:MAG: 2-hydroxyacyl-CoA dehydratase [Caulobacteraceae bacterium]
MPGSSATSEQGVRAIGWVGLDAPLELIEAAGLRPDRISANARAAAGPADVYGEGGGHPWMRALASELIEVAPRLQRVVLCSTPVNELWLYNFILSLNLRREGGAFPPVELLNLSHETRPSAQRLNLVSLEAIARSLGATDAGAVQDAIAGRNRVRAALRAIDALRHRDTGRISGVQARRLMDAADNLRSDDYLSWLAAQPPGEPAKGLPVIYSGPAVPSLDLYAALESHGLRIVGDDADAGSRAIGPDVKEGGDSFEAIAARYTRRTPAPAGWSTADRIAWLSELAGARGARAVLFDLPPWSHPAAWDYPAERRALEAQGLVCFELPADEPRAAASAAAGALAALIAESAHV